MLDSFANTSKTHTYTLTHAHTECARASAGACVFVCVCVFCMECLVVAMSSKLVSLLDAFFVGRAGGMEATRQEGSRKKDRKKD